jgi:hypothetical protein
MVREVRSPWSRERSGPSPDRRVGVSSWSSNRADSGHRVHTIGKSGHQPVSARRDSTPVVGGNRTQFSDLDRR